jgi:hypothetical protein
MPTQNPVVLAQVVSFGVFLWLGLYLLVRVARRTPLIIAGLAALLGQATFFASSVLTFNTQDLATLVVLERIFWWTAVLPVAAWFHFSDLIARQMIERDQRRSRTTWSPLVVIVYVAAGIIAVGGSFTNLFLRYAEPVIEPGPRFAYLERGPAYPIQVAYLAVVGIGATINLVRALRRLLPSTDEGDRALARQLRLLIAGALPFLIGGLYISSRYVWNPAVTVLPGYLLLLTGLAMLGYGIAHFGLLLEGQNIQRDFVYNLTGVVLVNVLYVGVLSLTGSLSLVSVVLLVGLATLTHTTFDSGRQLLDTLFFNRAERDARAEARDYATVLGTLPVAPPAAMQPVDEVPSAVDEPSAIASELPNEPVDEKAFKNLVRRAISSLKSPPQLAKSPLLTLEIVEQRLAQAGQADNRLNRASALREILVEQIDTLRPTSDETVKVGEAWRFYNVLHYPYVRELSRKGALAEARRLSEDRRRNGQRQPGEFEQVLLWLADVDEDTFYKWQRKASDTIATMLWEENSKLKVLSSQQQTQGSRTEATV